MKVRFKEQPNYPPHVFMRAAGYARKVNHEGEESYVRRLSGFEFPRFHAYTNVNAQPTTTISLHIDQKEHTYEGMSAHSGEYSGPLIEKELMRIRDMLQCQFVVQVDEKGNPVGR